MKKLHIANVNFEFLIDRPQQVNLASSFYLHPNFLQLQFLPPLYTQEPYLTTTKMGINNFTFDNPPEGDFEVESWGYSPLIAEWAHQKGYVYHMPSYDLVKLASSKKFSFLNSPQLPGSKLISSTDDLDFDQYPVVLKSEYGFAGRGLKIYHAPPDPKDPFIQRELTMGRCLIAEPWVQTHLNFSTQYYLSPTSIEKLTSCIIENDAKGAYLSTYTGVDHLLRQYTEHYIEAEKLLKKLQTMGYFGHVGVDAFIWDKGLHPIVEINPRKTMSYVAFRHAQEKQMQFKWQQIKNCATNLLPSQLNCKNKTHFFSLGLDARKTNVPFQN
ncbi:MAG: ATP-grasp domain-containing protein [Simkaniaceae bacterium]|nr:ATP-grasp domain-containing protein [Simkaniaceae bacterium]MCF7852285.1 ATP-grasp domain-containing protein [Simkaniaceae bacterium]